MAREQRSKDRRIQKTQKLLYEALGSLIREKPYDEIVVKEILDRANVGRSTFYTHFKDKDESLTSGIHDMFKAIHSAGLPVSGKKHERMIRFSLPVFEHIQRHRQAGAAGMGTRGRAIIHEHLQKVLAELIADDIGGPFRGRRKTGDQIPSELLVQYVASTFVLVLNWWVETDSKLSPMEVDDLFRTLTLGQFWAAHLFASLKNLQHGKYAHDGVVHKIHGATNSRQTLSGMAPRLAL